MHRYLWLVPAILVVMIIAGCSGEDPGICGGRVTVSITAPAAGEEIDQGTTTPIAVTVDATEGVDRVVFQIDGQTASTDTVAPYSYSWDTKNVSLGEHTITVIAYDKSSPEKSCTATRTVTIKQPPFAPPTVSILEPSAGDEVGCGEFHVDVQAWPQEPGATITKIDVSLDGIMETVTGDSGEVNFNPTQLANGSHDIVAVATDSNNVTGSAKISVTVNNPLPTVNITGPQNGATVGGVFSVAVDASSGCGDVGIAKIDVTANGLTKTITGGSGEVTFNSLQLANGANTITAVATDTLGLVGQASISVTVENFTVYVQNATVASGGNVTVSVEMSDTTGVAGFAMTINYDAAALQVVGGNAGVQLGQSPAGAASAPLLMPNTATAGVITVAVAGTSEFASAEQEILTIEFQAIGSPGSTIVDIDDSPGAPTPLGFSDVMGSAITPTPLAVDGTVTIQ